MSDVELTWRTSARSSGKQGGLSALLDDVMGPQVGQTIWRSPGGWQQSPLYTEEVSLVGVASTSGGGLGAWQPASGHTVVIRRAIVYVSQASTGAANLTAGVGASATTSYTNLITATSVAATGIIDSITNEITAVGPVAVLMTSGQFLTFSGSATTAGLIGKALIEYWDPGV